MIDCNIDIHGTKRWYKDYNLHREDGPAVVYLTGTEYWYYHGALHRIDGPAVMVSNCVQFWYVHGEQCYCPLSFQKLAKLSDEEMLVLTIKYGNIS